MLGLHVLQKTIPSKCFEKSLSTSLMYMCWDMLVLATMLLVYPFVENSLVGLFVYANFYGFYMWCVFVIGHDCGHSSFSNYTIINNICGHICHSILLVPFWPWQLSHRQHHLHHNHISKDKSHQWLVDKSYNRNSISNILYNISSPFAGFFAYLYMGNPDGSHIVPFSSLFHKVEDRLKCIVSTGCIGYVAWSIYSLDLVVCYALPWFVFHFWVFSVTYMQHHTTDTLNHNKTKVYDNTSWSFLKGALETIDRKYGYYVDELSHNITDCHVVHHLFFTKIPHYHLAEATRSIAPLLIKEGLYKFCDHSWSTDSIYTALSRYYIVDFWRTLHYVNNYGFKLVADKY
jgi:omega-3 fatty acid desaturase (delta-15 desaturase)